MPGFFTAGTCDILDYQPQDVALNLIDSMVQKPKQPQPHIVACPFLFP